MGTRCADHVIPLYPKKLALTSPTGGGRSVGIVRVRTKATEFIKALIFASPNLFLTYHFLRTSYAEVNPFGKKTLILINFDIKI